MECGIGPTKSSAQPAAGACEASNLHDEVRYHCEGFSGFWRLNTSSVAETELANLLRAMRKVGGHLGPTVGRIEWAGMSHGGGACIVLDPAIISGEYPVPPQQVDYVLGLLVHEAISKTQWTELVWKELADYFQDMKILHKIMLQKIVDTGERIYCDLVADQSVLGLYTGQTRRVVLQRARRKIPSGTASVDELVHVWWESTWDHEPISEQQRLYDGPLDELKSLSGMLKDVSTSSRGVHQRCLERSALYLETWEKTRSEITPMKIFDKMILWDQEPNVVTRTPKPQTGAGGKSAGLSPAVARRVEAELAKNSTDITPIILSVVGHDNEDVVPMSRWDFNIPASPVVDPKQVARLRAIFQTYSERSKLVNRGLTRGKVDRKRLYRAPINGRCFMEKQYVSNMNWNICLLVDASGSMRGPKWRLVENTVATIRKAFLGFENSFLAYAYFEANGISMIANLLKGRNLVSIPPSGQTASGQAIIAAAYFMPRDGRRRFLIHITDGESNFGCHVQHGIDYCTHKNIHLVTLGCGYRDRRAMEKQYGKSIQFLNSFGQLPSALESLLRRTFVYGNSSRHGHPNPCWPISQPECQGGTIS